MQQDKRQGLLQYGTIGVEFIAAFGLCVGGGYWLDRALGTLPAFTLVGLGVGFAAAMYRLVRRAQEIQGRQGGANHEGDEAGGNRTPARGPDRTGGDPDDAD